MPLNSDLLNDDLQFEIGECVRLLGSDKIGYICDIRIDNAKALYTVDCFYDCDGESLCDYLFTVEEHEIAKL